MKRYLWILALPALAAAQAAPVDVSAPTLGYVWEDQTHSLRPVEGVPGSAALGSAVNLGASLERIAIAPGRRFALGQEAGADNLLIVRLDGAIGSARRSELPAGDVFFSPSGETVAIALTTRVDVWTGFREDRPRRVQSFPSGDPGLRSVFVSDDGNQVLTLSSGSLYRLSGDSAPEPIGDDGYQDVAFLRNSQDAIAAHSTKGVVMLRKAERDSEEVITAIEAPLKVAVSVDEKLIAVLLNGSIALIDRASQQITPVSLDGIAADALIRAQGNAVFQLTANAGNEIWFIDADSASPRLVAATKGEVQ